MRKEGVIFIGLIVLLLFTISSTSAQNCTINSDCPSGYPICHTNDTCIKNASASSATITAKDDSATKVQKAYDCLENKVKDNCPTSMEENIFVLMAIKKCKDSVISNSKFKSDVKSTAQAIIALDIAGEETTSAEEWLISQNGTPDDVVWYLQTESSEATTCSVKYSGASYSFSIRADKTISSNAGSCLSLSEGAFWLRISPACYEKDFEISCNKGFQTNLLFKKKTSSTVYVSEKTTSASAEGTTTEKVNSLCFKQGNICTYEGSLWAVQALSYRGYDTSGYLPYLITLADDNSKYLPESFLYYLISSGDFRSKILTRQINDKYWDVSGDKFYDTALALFPFQSEEPAEKTNTINWLLEPGVQDSDGCWKGNIRNTAFLLASLWPESSQIINEPEQEDCLDNNGYCMSENSCEGDILQDYSCPGIQKCCSVPRTEKTCTQLLGEKCASNQICAGGRFEDASDSTTCCVNGNCEDEVALTECETNSGNCRSSGCGEDEESSTYSCDADKTCCVAKPIKESWPWWIWLLIILIILVIVIIIFRNMLRVFWMRTKSKFGKSQSGARFSSGQGPPRFPPSSPGGMALMRPMPRRILPSTQRPILAQPVGPRKSKSELDDVLNKLRSMGK